MIINITSSNYCGLPFLNIETILIITNYTCLHVDVGSKPTLCSKLIIKIDIYFWLSYNVSTNPKRYSNLKFLSLFRH